MGFFNNNNTGVSLSKRQQLEAKFQSARTDLLLIVAFTVINIILLVTGSNSYFVFSAYIPYSIAYLGMLLCGKFPNEYYEDIEEVFNLGDTAFVVFIAVAVVLTLLYLLCWHMSKNFKSGWLIFGLVMISIDTAFLLLGGLELSSIIDILFHVWMIVTMSMGLSANKKLKELPEEPQDEFITDDIPPEEQTAKLNGKDIDE